MSDLRKNLKNEFQDPAYRYAYAESFLNTKIATQIKTLREIRGLKQAELGTRIGTKQSGFSRFEDVNHSVWKTDTLWKIARALDVRLNISLDTFGSLIDEKEHFSKEALARPAFKDDPAFTEKGATALSIHEGGLMQQEAGKYAYGGPTPASELMGASLTRPVVDIGDFRRQNESDAKRRKGLDLKQPKRSLKRRPVVHRMHERKRLAQAKSALGGSVVPSLSGVRA